MQMKTIQHIRTDAVRPNPTLAEIDIDRRLMASFQLIWMPCAKYLFIRIVIGACIKAWRSYKQQTIAPHIGQRAPSAIHLIALCLWADIIHPLLGNRQIITSD